MLCVSERTRAPNDVKARPKTWPLKTELDDFSMIWKAKATEHLIIVFYQSCWHDQMCSSMLCILGCVFHHLCRADDRQRCRQAARWPAVVSTPRSVGMQQIFHLGLLKLPACSFRMASTVTVSALRRKSSDFSGIGGGESFWQGVKESWSSSLSLSDLTLMDCFVVREQGKRC